LKKGEKGSKKKVVKSRTPEKSEVGRRPNLDSGKWGNLRRIEDN